MFDYSALRDIQKKEMESSAIVNLSDDFYQIISELLSKKKKDALSSQSLLAIKEYENIKKIVLSISAKREEKIALMAVRGEGDLSGLTTEEKQMLKDLTSIIIKSRESVKNVWSAISSISERRIKILKNVAQYRGLNDSLYGPFEEGEEKTLPLAEAEWLLKAGMAEMLGD
ncbi:hypothetical protein KKB44_00285 [Candidatus Micrarchaeota archaeon]|nr:hypothetical protein [Candidatus Micrarchaeota archaeon]